MIILLGVGVIGLGYLLMAMGGTMSALSLTIAPLILVIGYAVVVPYGILYGSRTKKTMDTLTPEPTVN